MGPNLPPTATDPSPHYQRTKIVTTAPRAVVSVYGLKFFQKEHTITRNVHGATDTASFTIQTHGNPDLSSVLKNPSSADGAIVVQIYFGFPTSQSTDPGTLQPLLTQRFLGIVDSYKVSANNDTYEFECSSLATLLLAEKQTTLVQNQTTTQYLAGVAANAGLAVSIKLHGGATSSSVTLKDVFADDFVTGIRNERPWDILKACAEVDDVDLFEHDGTIYYWAPEDEKRTHVVLTYGTDFKVLDGEHSPQFAKNIEVQVISYNPKTKLSYSTRYTSDGSGSATKTTQSVTVPKFGTAGSTTVTTTATGTTVRATSSSGGVFKTGQTTIERASSKERIILHRPNITPDEADALALAEWKKRSRYEYRLPFTLPITPTIFPNLAVETVYELYGWNATAFNSSPSSPAYFVRRMTEKFSVDDGATVDIEGVNHALAAEATI